MAELSTVDVSIIIPSWNSEATIRECLESVFAQRTSHSFEVIVVDSSSDGTDQVVREFTQVKLIKLEKRTYSGTARNIGVAESTAPVILFLDSDAIAEPLWIEKMMQWHERENCAAVAGAILNGNPESYVSWASYMTEFSEYMPVGKPHYQAIGVTANLSYKRWVFEKHGGFSEILKQYVDTEFNCRLNQGGDKLLFVPNIFVKHKHRTTLKAYLKHETGRGRSALALRRHGYLSYNSLAHSKWLCVMVSGFVLVKLVCGNIRRFSRARMLPLRKTVRVIPISILGSLAWTVGFLLESIKPTINLPDVGARSVKSETIAI